MESAWTASAVKTVLGSNDCIQYQIQNWPKLGMHCKYKVPHEADNEGGAMLLDKLL